MTLEIAKMLVLSTWHIGHKTAASFDRAENSGVPFADCGDGDIWSMTVYEKGQWGYIFPIIDDYIEDHKTRAFLPSDLLTVIDFAHAQGCSWVMFDRDADQIDGLPVYDW